jgi:hypothetical protein
VACRGWAAIGVLAVTIAVTGCATDIAGVAQPAPDSSAEVCSWLPVADVQSAFGLSGLTAQRNGPIFDHNVAAYLCVYADSDGSNDAALETADFPDSAASPTQLVSNFASAGRVDSGSPQVGDASAFVDDLAGNANTAAVAVRKGGGRLRLVAIIVATSVGPDKNRLVSVLRGVFAKLP